MYCGAARLIRLVAAAGFGLALAVTSSAAAPFVAADTPRREFPDVDGTVNAVLITNGTVYVGGSFSYTAPHGPKVLSLDYFTGASDRNFPAVLGTAIHALVDDGNGGWFIGGDFSEAGALAVTNLAHVLADGSVDPTFTPQPNGPVRALLRLGVTLYVGGDFTVISNQLRGRGAAFDLASQQLLLWNPLANERITALVGTETMVLAGGYFTQLGGQTRNRLAALDPVTGAPTAFHPDADGAVLSLDLVEDRVFAGGFFNLMGGFARNGVAAINLANGAILPWNPNPQGGKVTCVRADCSTVYIGGYFTNLAGALRVRVGAVDWDSGAVTAWNPGLGLFDINGAPSYVLALALVGDRVYIGGQFSTVAGQTRSDLVAVDSRTASLLEWNPGTDGGVSALAVTGERVLAGFVASPGGATRRNLAAFDESTGRLLNWTPTTDGPVLAFAYAQDYLFVAGSFSEVNGGAHSRVAALDARTGALAGSWIVTADSAVSALAITDDTLYLGGNFSQINGVPRSRLAAVFLGNGLLDDAWNPGADGAIDALRLSGPALYIGGSFSTVAGQTRRNLAALNPVSGAALAWNPDVNGRVRALAANANTIYAGGDFTLVGAQTRSRLAAINATNGTLLAWAPAADADVRALAWAEDRVYVGGSFLNVNAQPRRGLAVVDESGLLLPWNPGRSISNRVHVLSLGPTTLVAGGPLGLGLAGSPEVHALAAFAPVGAPVITQPPSSLKVFSGTAAMFSVAADGQAPLFFQWQFEGVDLPGEFGSSLVLSNAQISDEGTYSVIVQNGLGVTRADARLDVLVPVAISTVSGDVQTFSGTNVALFVTATGNPPPAYQWRLNGANIPGAVKASFALSNAQPRDGGTYDVLVANETGALQSNPIRVEILSPALPFTDSFAARNTITNAFGVGSGNNFFTSVEANEPNHAGKVGGKSIWLRWRPPVSGVGTLSTKGSSFDTLLAVYNGNDFITNFTLVASSEDQAGFNNSTVTFNATANLAYQIAVDGYAGASGEVVLTWQVTTNNTEFPRIVTPPVSRSVSLGATAVFTVTATSPTPFRYQWFFGCRALAGETNAALTITGVQPRHVGAYHVVVMNASSQVAQSEDFFLEIGPLSSLVAQEKAGDLFLIPPPGTNNPAPPPRAPSNAASGPSAFVSVSVGTIGSQTLNNTGAATSPGEPVHCQVPGGHSKWFGLQPVGNATFQIDTIGSAIDTVLAVYTQDGILAPLMFVACDNNGAPDRLRSVVRFPSQAGQSYLVAVDGVNGVQGAIRLNWKLNVPPQVTSLSPPNQVALRGARVTLAVAVANTNPPPWYQWRLNGVNLAGATRASLTLSNLQGPQSGHYSVVVSNFAGLVTNMVSTLTVDVPLNVERPIRTANGACRFTVVGNPGQQYVTLQSTDLVSWTPIRTNTLSGWETNHTDATVGPRRFFRVAPFPQTP